MKCVLIFILLLYISVVNAKFYKTNITDFSRCKIHYSIQERTYKQFYHFNEVEQRENDNNTLIDFHFSVLAMSDAHILLAPSTNLANGPVYEIVLGAGGNTFCDIRRNQKSSVQASVRTKNILSAIDIRSFWLHIYKNGTIAVGREGETSGFISWRDTNLLPITVFSFSTWGNVEAKWYFECPREENNSHNEVDVGEVQKLRKHLLANYNPYVRPTYDSNEKTIISFKILTNFLTLDEKSSTLNVNGRASFLWQDDKLKWIPEKYNGIKSLHVYHGEIWKPDIIIQNGISPKYMDPFESSFLVISSDGFIVWDTAFNTHVLCNGLTFNQWPNDIHACSLDISFWYQQMSNLELKYTANDSQLFGENFDNGWKVTEVVTETQYDNLNLNIPALRLNLKIKRHTEIYGNVLYAPYFIIVSMLLLSFWISPLSYLKVFLLALQLVITSILLIGLAYILPSGQSKLPYLVFLYNSVMLEGIGCVLIAIIVINLSRNEQTFYPPHFITNILGIKFVEMCLLLPNQQEDEDEADCKWYEVLKKNEKVSTAQKMWFRIAIFIDRFAFIFYFLLNFGLQFIEY